ncbi:MAG: S-layer protein [Methanoregulaceae archaeon]|nr:S-layer protein [Methanoregulaceae archaeon]
MDISNGSGKPEIRFQRAITLFIFAALVAAILASPVSAGTKYMQGSPELSAALQGTNEFLPGTDVNFTVIVQNSGLNDIKFVQSGIVDRDDLPNTAKLANINLSAGTSPVTIKSDAQMVGDIRGGTSLPVKFNAKIAQDAPAGEFFLPLAITYTYLENSEQIGQDSIIYTYREKELLLNLPIRIKPEVRAEITGLAAEHVNVGTDGYVTLDVMNIGSEDGRGAIIRILRNGNSPVIPVDNSVYIGNFPKNSTVQCRYKIAISKDAGEQNYPLDVAVVYENSEGDTVTSDTKTVSVPVGGKIDFRVVSTPAQMNIAGKKVIDIEYENTGAATAYSAQARLSAVDPFTSSDDTAFLGDIGPGERATARFELGADGAATVKEYGLDSEIRYRDALDNSQISDTMKVRIVLIPRSGLDPITISIIAVVLIGAAYYFLVVRRKKE